MKRLLKLAISFYVILYCLPFPFGFVIGTAPVIEAYFKFLISIATWIGVHVLAMDHVVAPSGSGDTPANYLIIVVFMACACVAAVLWRLAVRERRDKDLRICAYHYVRVAVANYLMLYGFSKIILPGQFGELTPGRLMESFGDSSPMSLLWSFMAASKSYTIFGGALEVLAGSLLFIRRFVTLGAFLSLAVMANVFMLNISYDVPVKLFSLHLLMLSGYLIWPDLKRLIRFFVMNLPTEPNSIPQFHKKRFLAAEIIFVLVLTTSAISSGFKGVHYYQQSIAETKFFGRWQVLEPSGTTSLKDRWAQVAFDLDNQFYVRTANGGWLRFRVQPGADKKLLALESMDGRASNAHLTVVVDVMEEMRIVGDVDAQPISLRLHKEPVTATPLQTRGFHWMTDVPFER